MSDKPKKRVFTKHAKSSAMLVSLAVHAVLILVAATFVAVTVVTKEEKKFEAKKVHRPKQPLKKLRVPVKVTKKKPKPKLRKRLLAKRVDRKTPDFKMPEITGVKGGLGAMGDGGGMAGIGFSMPEIDFFGAKAKGEKVCFIVHFGPATIGDNPFKRMTGYTIRKRLEDMVSSLPDYTLFNVMAYFASEAAAINSNMMPANPENKQKVMEWMAPVNPLEGDYGHCLSYGPAKGRINDAKANWPTRVDDLPFYSMKWAYPYRVPEELEEKYVPGAEGFKHWGRGVAWAILTQKPDAIFVLTTNYIDGWGGGANGQPSKMLAGYKKMFLNTYGPDKKTWPTINVVVLAKVDVDKSILRANKILNDQFGPIWRGTKGNGSIIEDITDYMTDDEEDLLEKYRAEYGE